MRSFVRTTLLTTLITLAILAALAFLRWSVTGDAASAASGLQVPRYCIPPELAGLQSLLAKTTDPAARGLLLSKEKAAKKAALDCAADATAHPPAPKPENLAGVLLPTSMPGPTAVIPAGVHHAELLPVADFIPADDGYNVWAGTVNGHAAQVFAGSMRDSEENWQQEHPDWQAHPELHVQGALRVALNGNELKTSEYPTPSRHGILHIVTACGSVLVLQAADGVIFTFDSAALTYVKHFTACAVPTP